ncbi:MAG TPA: type VI secretion system tip protein VgrG [Ohtaekwangia sp.]|uniref:type VI secretion system tip protein VgrG n=1 Tax=Ohtaekwangia sp. TaxID=2066019 RepID=UPI002F92913F
MSDERTIPSNKPKSVCTFTILSDGNQVPGTYHVISIIVNKEVNRIPSATILILDGDAAKETFEVSNAADFEPGKKIEIKAGWVSDEETIFKGIVIKQNIKVKNNNSILMVECRDESMKMTLVPKSKYYKDKKDSEIFEEIIGTYSGLSKDVEATTLQHKEVVQYNSTDWDFMVCRADVNGKLVIVDDGKISIAKPNVSAAAELTAQYGSTVLDLDAEIDARLQLPGVKAASWNFTDQQLLDTVDAAEPSVPAAGNLSSDQLKKASSSDPLVLIHSGKITEAELQQWANARLQKNRLAKIRGRVKVEGFAKMKPGKILQLNGVGARFEGKVFVTGIRHQIEHGNWTTHMQFGTNPEWFAETYTVQQPLAGAMLPPIQGLQIGIVTKLEEDPDGEDRIMVRLPVVHKNDEGIWCRVASLDAGKERGFFFRPELEDEVIVGFIDDDPRHAVVLGMLNSSKLPAHTKPKDTNHIKGYVSREKMKWMFDDEKKIISIETPGGNKIVISEEDKGMSFIDQNGNKIVMNDQGIKIESIKDFTLKAAKDMKAEGLNTEVKASAQMKMKGDASAEFSSGGNTNLKGAIVNIN